MKKFLDYVEEIMEAITFAESGDADTARWILLAMKKRQEKHREIKKNRKDIVVEHCGSP